MQIRKKYVVNEHNEPVAVLLDLGTFQRIEQLLEDYSLGQSMKAVEDEPGLDLQAARKRYARLKKAHK
jgi:PHD/YefM family antitoxin component YafN of YafNO toxin-antitoxin module